MCIQWTLTSWWTNGAIWDGVVVSDIAIWVMRIPGCRKYCEGTAMSCIWTLLTLTNAFRREVILIKRVGLQTTSSFKKSIVDIVILHLHWSFIEKHVSLQNKKIWISVNETQILYTFIASSVKLSKMVWILWNKRCSLKNDYWNKYIMLTNPNFKSFSYILTSQIQYNLCFLKFR